MRTDKELIDWLESMSVRRLVVSIDGGKIFAEPCQHQKAGNVRELLSIAMDFDEGKRDWKEECWGRKRVSER